jgi:nicotinamide mononucleotide transporter
VWLTVRRHVACWPVGLVGVLAYLFVFVRARLYADAGLQVVYLAQGVYGWWAWTRDVRRAEPPVRALGGRARLALSVLVAAASLALGAGLAARTDAAAPYADAALSVGSLAANQLLTRRLVESWVLWVLVDVGYVWLFAAKGLHVSAVLYAVFLAMAAAGLRDWARALRTARAATAAAA